MVKNQFRHGDLLIEAVDGRKKSGLKDTKQNIVEEGEATGHMHRIQGNGTVLIPKGEVDFRGEEKYIDAFDDSVSIIHEEHNEIKIPKGLWKVTRQREWNAYEQASRTVLD